jgi:hypothetical protein
MGDSSGRLKPDETDLVGNWITTETGVDGDAVEERITELIVAHLHKMSIRPEAGAWAVLYRDPNDGRYWELTHPQSEMHGSGPKRLTNLSAATARAKYRLVV